MRCVPRCGTCNKAVWAEPHDARKRLARSKTGKLYCGPVCSRVAAVAARKPVMTRSPVPSLPTGATMSRQQVIHETFERARAKSAKVYCLVGKLATEARPDSVPATAGYVSVAGDRDWTKLPPAGATSGQVPAGQ